MPIRRINKSRATKLSRRVAKVLEKKGGLTTLINGSGVWNKSIYNALDAKCINESNAEKLEQFLDGLGVKPLTKTYIHRTIPAKKTCRNKVISQ